jgi:hypothetical protein
LENEWLLGWSLRNQRSELVNGDYAQLLEAGNEQGVQFDSEYVLDNNVTDLPKTSDLTDAELVTSPGFQRASELLYNAIIGDKNRSGVMTRRKKASLQRAPKSPEEYAAWGIEYQGSLEYNLPKAAINFNKLGTLAKDNPLLAVASLALQEEYAKLGLSWNGTKRFFAGMFTDPTTYAGLSTLGWGFLGRQGAKQTTKKGLTNFLKKALDPRLLTVYEAGGYTAAEDYIRQQKEIRSNEADPRTGKSEFDNIQSAISTGIGLAGGGAIVGGIEGAKRAAPYIAEGIRNLGKDADKRIAARKADGSFTLNTGVDPMPAVDSILSMTGKALTNRSDLKTEGGINFTKESTDNNLRLHLSRIEKENIDNVKYPGGPKNPRTVIKSKDQDLPDIVVGEIKFDDWKNRIESTMDKDEILNSSRWYDDVFVEFDKQSGGDPKEMRKLGEAWLSAQQNETPSSALSNVLSIYEQYKRNVPIENIKGKGLPSANKIATDIIFGKPVTGGAGQKISDFIDSGYGKDVRSIMGNDPLGGSPFVVDVHTGRDTGLVDQEFINHLNRLGYDVPQNLIKDHGGGGIKGTMYENRAKFGQELTEYLNGINWLEKSDWKPKEIQAIGWMNLTQMTGQLGTSGDVAGAFNRNLRRISMEVDPGEGSPWATKFGADYGNLDDAAKFDINNQVTARAIELVNKKEGLNLTSNVHGTGGWELYQNPSTVSQAFSSRDTAVRAGARLGFLLNQTEVWVNSAKEITKGAKHFGVDIVEEGSNNLRNSETLTQLFEMIIEADPNGLFRGYQPIIVDGKPGIRIIIDDEAIKNSPLTKAKAQDYIKEFAGTEGGLNNILENLNFDVEAAITEVELTKLRNDWKEKPNGEGYKEYFSDQTRATQSSGNRSNTDNDGQELENFFAELIQKAKQKKD